VWRMTFSMNSLPAQRAKNFELKKEVKNLQDMDSDVILEVEELRRTDARKTQEVREWDAK